MKLGNCLQLHNIVKLPNGKNGINQLHFVKSRRISLTQLRTAIPFDAQNSLRNFLKFADINSPGSPSIRLPRCFKLSLPKTGEWRRKCLLFTHRYFPCNFDNSKNSAKNVCTCVPIAYYRLNDYYYGELNKAKRE